MSLSKIADVIIFGIVTLLLVLCGIEFFGVKVTLVIITMVIVNIVFLIKLDENDSQKNENEPIKKEGSE
ncbi:hypothetical protein ACEWAM_23030 [Vibrio parahaemolyticus]